MTTRNGLRPWAQHKSPSSPSGEAQEMMVVDPRAMLAQQAPARRRGAPGALFWLVVFLIVAQLFFPPEYKPGRVVGDIAADFHAQIMTAHNEKELDLAEQDAVARTRAARENQYVQIQGLCAATAIFDPQLAMYCAAANEVYHQHALPPAREYRKQYRESR